MSAGSMISFEIRGRRLGEGVRAFVRAKRGDMVGLLLHHLTHLVKRVFSAQFALRQGHCRPFAELWLFSIAMRPSEQGQRAGASLLGTVAAPLRRTLASSSRPEFPDTRFPAKELT